MLPLLFRLGDAGLQTYIFLVSVAYFLGLGIWIKEGHREGLEAGRLVNLSLQSAAAAFIGARLLFILTQIPNWWAGRVSGSALFLPWEGGVVFMGGFIAGALALYLLCRRQKLSPAAVFNSAAPALCFAHAVGRLACFANGCCFGDFCRFPWAVVYRNPLAVARPLGVPLHPSQLYEMFGLILLGSFLLWRRRTKRRDSFVLYLLGYGVLRFLVEFTRGDPWRGSWAGLSTSQWLSLVMIALSLVLYRRSQTETAPETATETAT